ncbi:MAG: methylmalonyl Co-A mutase-associated GTPase MeaB, partial [Acidobacteriota bacterium]
MSPPRRRPSTEELADGVARGDRALLARAITLVESRRPEHREQAQDLLQRLLPSTGGALRVGITGVPGVGKSTFIEALGRRLLSAGHRPAVLAVDPSSSVSGGSILGDKTRMPELAADPRAYVRPSPSGGSLGGVAHKTRETLLLCEAAGYDVVLVETVGVGQSEIVVAEMVDTLLLLLLPGAGDELQGIKRGILELIDVVAVNKADGANAVAAQQARIEYRSGLKLVRPLHAEWSPPVLTCSGLAGEGLGEVWAAVEEHRGTLQKIGAFDAKRRRQMKNWLWSLLEERLMDAFRRDPAVAQRLPHLERAVSEGGTTPGRAAAELLDSFLGEGAPRRRDA